MSHLFKIFLMEKMDVRFRFPFSCLVAGATMTGKTRWVIDLLKSDMIDTEIKDKVVCFSEWQPSYEELRSLGCRFVEGLLNPEELDPRVTRLVIIDDLMDTADKRIEKFFTKTCHHRNTSCIYIVQNLFNQGRGHRTCSLNSQYIVLLRSPRDVTQIRTLENQMFPGKKNFLVESFNDACSKPYSPLLIDLKPDTPDHLRVRGRPLDKESQDVYLPLDFKYSYNPQS